MSGWRDLFDAGGPRSISKAINGTDSRIRSVNISRSVMLTGDLRGVIGPPKATT
jgi:hypothetical protein